MYSSRTDIDVLDTTVIRIYPVRVVPVGNIPKPSKLSHGTIGWDGQLGLFYPVKVVPVNWEPS